MSAAAYGEGLLSEVKEESLDKDLECLSKPPEVRQRSQYHPHSDEQDAPLPLPQSTSSKQPPAVVEITGVTPCSGKTQLLHLIIATAILPRQFHGSTLGGKGQAVVLLDLSSTFSILRLRDIMHNLILTHCKSPGATPTPAAISSLIESALLHLHIFHPTSTPSIISTLASLESYLCPSPGLATTHFSAARSLGLIALSNLSSFLWQDRLDAADAALLPPSPTQRTTTSSSSLLHDRYRALTHQLAHLQTLLSCLIVATTSSPFPVASTSQPTSLRPHLPHPWPGFATCKLIVQRQTVPKFGPGTSVEEANTERGRRWDVVKEGRFSGCVNRWGADEGGWRDEWREGMRRVGGGGRFGFVVDGQGVRMMNVGEDGSA